MQSVVRVQGSIEVECYAFYAAAHEALYHVDVYGNKVYTIAVNGSAILKTERKFSYADYKEWELEEGERYELIYGDACAMSAPNAYHQSILIELSRQIANYLVGKPWKIYPAPFDVRLFYEEDESDDTVVQPDITIVCDQKKRGKEGCRGAPDFIAEILSPSNTAIEMERKLKLYRDAGVREYWIIDPENKRLTVYIFEEFKETQIKAHIYGSSDTVSLFIFPDLTVDLEPVFAEDV